MTPNYLLKNGGDKMKNKLWLKVLVLGSMALMFFANIASASACSVLSYQPEMPKSLLK